MVVFPAPFGPRNPTISPRPTVNPIRVHGDHGGVVLREILDLDHRLLESVADEGMARTRSPVGGDPTRKSTPSTPRPPGACTPEFRWPTASDARPPIMRGIPPGRRALGALTEATTTPGTGASHESDHPPRFPPGASPPPPPRRPAARPGRPDARRGAIPPIGRTRPSHLKLSLAAYSTASSSRASAADGPVRLRRTSPPTWASTPSS